jgi:CubicO group peptidase (beta-lactamase class C family)
MRSRRNFLRSGTALLVSGLAPRNAVYGQHPAEVLSTPAATPKPAVPAVQEKPDFTGIQEQMRGFLIREGVSAAQIAVVRNGVLQFSHAYGATPPRGYAPVTTDSLFRIASCSKMFTCAAITWLRSQGKVDMDASVFPLLGISSPAKPKDKPDPRIDDITVRQLVDHAGGWNDHESCKAKDGTHIPGTEWDPVFSVRDIAVDLKLSAPPSKMDLARYMYGRPLQFAPGTQDFQSTDKKSYSNFGYLLLGLVIESVTNSTYVDVLRTGMSVNAETDKVYLSRTSGQPINPSEVWYVDPGSGPTVFQPRSSVWLPYAYGGAGFMTELMDSAGGLMTNAETLALFSSRHAVWGLGGRAANSARSGGMAGTASFTYSQTNGIDCAYVLNTRTFNGGPKAQEDFMHSLQSLTSRL